MSAGGQLATLAGTTNGIKKYQLLFLIAAQYSENAVVSIRPLQLLKTKSMVTFFLIATLQAMLRLIHFT